jgi:hypothetical protein
MSRVTTLFDTIYMHATNLLILILINFHKANIPLSFSLVSLLAPLKVLLRSRSKKYMLHKRVGLGHAASTSIALGTS